MKGIVLAGGQGTRLYPSTKVVSKQLLTVYDKPMIYYPLSILMISEIKDILIISTPQDTPLYKNLLGNGDNFGLNINYMIQEKPEGIAQAFMIAKDFIGNDNVCLILGDNIFYGNGLSKLLKKSIRNCKDHNKATVFGYYVNDPERYGVVSFDPNRKVTKIEEKPSSPKSNYAVTGLYIYPNSVIDIATRAKKSNRGEYEISDINNVYLGLKKLIVELLDKDFVWLDTGTHESMLEASNFIKAIENRQGSKIACLEEIAYKKNYISKLELQKIIESIKKSEYGIYLRDKVL
ncbi:MAG: glucose-1-phosphate thymidylyltransferase RfbA [Bacteroidota bacterium]|nr:glucose-1-phosphate thymidylyltransferase RfbA [Bacteroidota bacterium]|tara:strand:+ start:1362 stop:2234 length:873 start_codon:yes stop_codon:yes gene_type:complete